MPKFTGICGACGKTGLLFGNSTICPACARSRGHVTRRKQAIDRKAEARRARFVKAVPAAGSLAVPAAVLATVPAAGVDEKPNTIMRFFEEMTGLTSDELMKLAQDALRGPGGKPAIKKRVLKKLGLVERVKNRAGSWFEEWFGQGEDEEEEAPFSPVELEESGTGLFEGIFDEENAGDDAAGDAGDLVLVGLALAGLAGLSYAMSKKPDAGAVPPGSENPYAPR